MTPVRNTELRVGDTIDVWWQPRFDRITALRKYDGPRLDLLGAGTKLADFQFNKTGMTLAGVGWSDKLTKEEIDAREVQARKEGWRP